MTPEEAFLAEVSRQIDECMAKIADPRWRIADRTIARNLPPLAAKAACQPWCGRALPDDGVAVYGFIDGPEDEREFFKLSGATCRRKGYVLGWCSMKCRDRAAQPAEIKRTEGHIRLCRVNRGGDCNCTGLAQPAEQPKQLTARDVNGGPVRSDSKFTDDMPVKFMAKLPARHRPAEQPKPAKGPVCQAATGRCPDAPKTRIIMDYIRKKPLRVEWCDPCALAYEQHHVTTAQYGKPYTGPERIVKPPMAHSMGLEDPTLPEAR
jgi:hypothetical protein